MVTQRGRFTWADTLGWQQRKFLEIEIVRRVHDMTAEDVAIECRRLGVPVGDRRAEDLRADLVDALCARLP
jgi:hypothetical protein